MNTIFYFGIFYLKEPIMISLEIKVFVFVLNMVTIFLYSTINCSFFSMEAQQQKTLRPELPIQARQMNIAIMSDPTLLLYRAVNAQENENTYKIRLFYEIGKSNTIPFQEENTNPV